MKRVVALVWLALLAACSQAPDEPAAKVVAMLAADANSDYDTDVFVSQLGLTAYTEMSQAGEKAQQLDAKISAFLFEPSKAHLIEAQEAWRSAYSAFLFSRIYAFLPLSDPSDWSKKGQNNQQTLYQLDAWPIEGGYIDYLAGYPFSGIVNDLALELNEKNLLEQHGFADKSYASIGFHPIEFMLWGEDGKRSWRDFVAQENTSSLPADDTQEIEAGDSERPKVQNNNRRRQYLQLTSELLQKHLLRLQERWEPSKGYYPAMLTRAKSSQVLLASFTATQKLIAQELLAKRLNQDGSEFSQSSWQDIAALITGVRHLFLPDNGKQAGLNSIFTEEQPILAAWQTLFQQFDQNLETWQNAADQQQAKQACRQQLIELLTLLNQTASQLNMRLPSIN